MATSRRRDGAARESSILSGAAPEWRAACHPPPIIFLPSRATSPPPQTVPRARIELASTCGDHPGKRNVLFTMNARMECFAPPRRRLCASRVALRGASARPLPPRDRPPSPSRSPSRTFYPGTYLRTSTFYVLYEGERPRDICFDTADIVDIKYR